MNFNVPPQEPMQAQGPQQTSVQDFLNVITKYQNLLAGNPFQFIAPHLNPSYNDALWDAAWVPAPPLDDNPPAPSTPYQYYIRLPPSPDAMDALPRLTNSPIPAEKDQTRRALEILAMEQGEDVPEDAINKLEYLSIRPEHVLEMDLSSDWFVTHTGLDLTRAKQVRESLLEYDVTTRTKRRWNAASSRAD